MKICDLSSHKNQNKIKQLVEYLRQKFVRSFHTAGGKRRYRKKKKSRRRKSRNLKKKRKTKRKYSKRRH